MLHCVQPMKLNKYLTTRKRRQPNSTKIWRDAKIVDIASTQIRPSWISKRSNIVRKLPMITSLEKLQHSRKIQVDTTKQLMCTDSWPLALRVKNRQLPWIWKRDRILLSTAKLSDRLLYSNSRPRMDLKDLNYRMQSTRSARRCQIRMITLRCKKFLSVKQTVFSMIMSFCRSIIWKWPQNLAKQWLLLIRAGLRISTEPVIQHLNFNIRPYTSLLLIPQQIIPLKAKRIMLKSCWKKTNKRSKKNQSCLELIWVLCTRTKMRDMWSELTPNLSNSWSKNRKQKRRGLWIYADSIYETLEKCRDSRCSLVNRVIWIFRRKWVIMTRESLRCKPSLKRFWNGIGIESRMWIQSKKSTKWLLCRCRNCVLIRA